MMLKAFLLGCIAFLGKCDLATGTNQLQRPIILGPLVGLVLGDLDAGIKIGATLEWNRKDDTKSSRIHIQLNDVSISSETDWSQMAKFHADWSKKFYDAMVPYLDAID